MTSSLDEAKKPNVFVVGAPKCGTTALATWLSEHPKIYVSPVKEPHYFSTEYQLTYSLQNYQELFSGAKFHHKWLCEASVWYLFSPTAIGNILEYNPEAKFIAMVRNPLEMIPSMHQHQCFNGDELVRDLDAALGLNDLRLAGERIGVAEGYPSNRLAYLHSCALGWQVRRLLDKAPIERVHVIVFDDLKDDPRSVFGAALSFLGAPDHHRGEFERINTAKLRRLWWADRLVRDIGNWKARKGFRRRFGILSALRRWNRREAPPPALCGESRERVLSHLKDDVAELQDLLGRNLSIWQF